MAKGGEQFYSQTPEVPILDLQTTKANREPDNVPAISRSTSLKIVTKDEITCQFLDLSQISDKPDIEDVTPHSAPESSYLLARQRSS
jgi:hypothetical protein